MSDEQKSADQRRAALECIEMRYLMGTVARFSVTSYQEAIDSARHFTSPRALSFRGLIWTLDAPPVEKLTTEWQKPNCEGFRISDWETYAWQMRRLLGLV